MSFRQKGDEQVAYERIFVDSILTLQVSSTNYVNEITNLLPFLVIMFIFEIEIRK